MEYVFRGKVSLHAQEKAALTYPLGQLSSSHRAAAERSAKKGLPKKSGLGTSPGSRLPKALARCKPNHSRANNPRHRQDYPLLPGTAPPRIAGGGLPIGFSPAGSVMFRYAVLPAEGAKMSVPM